MEPKAPGLSRKAKLLHRILNAVFRHRDIVIDGELYLRRWFLTPRFLPVRLFLHCILREDEDRFLHDHPWNFHTLVLAGGYDEVYYPKLHARTHAYWRTVERASWEEPRDAAGFFRAHRRLKPGALVQNDARHAHAVKPYNGTVWTLVAAQQARLPEPGRESWGFYTDKGFKGWRAHLALPAATTDHPEDRP